MSQHVGVVPSARSTSPLSMGFSSQSWLINQWTMGKSVSHCTIRSFLSVQLLPHTHTFRPDLMEVNIFSYFPFFVDNTIQLYNTSWKKLPAHCQCSLTKRLNTCNCPYQSSRCRWWSGNSYRKEWSVRHVWSAPRDPLLAMLSVQQGMELDVLKCFAYLEYEFLLTEWYHIPVAMSYTLCALNGFHSKIVFETARKEKVNWWLLVMMKKNLFTIEALVCRLML